MTMPIDFTKPIKSRAAVAFAAGEPLQIVEIDVAPPKAGEVLIKISHTGVCHTDAFTLSGEDPEDVFPAVLGHEGAGQEISTRPFQLVTGRRWLGTAFGGVKGRTQLPEMVEQAMTGEIELAPFVTHTMPLNEINTAFELMHAGESIRSVVHF